MEKLLADIMHASSMYRERKREVHHPPRRRGIGRAYEELIDVITTTN
jgi:hypothetical protein